MRQQELTLTPVEAQALNMQDAATMRHCYHCKNIFPGASFPIQSVKPSGRIHRFYTCSECRTVVSSERRRTRTSKDPVGTSMRNKRLYYKRHYGLTPEEVDAKIIQQDGRCALCHGTSKRLHVDHCHSTQRIRSMLCTTCNIGLGSFLDSPQLLRAAADYLERHAASNAVETASP
jgi:hypothetical protein